MGSTSGTSGQTTETPEPLSLVLWTVLTGLGFWHVRRLRGKPATAA
jgi:hypothetical protein